MPNRDLRSLIREQSEQERTAAGAARRLITSAALPPGVPENAAGGGAAPSASAAAGGGRRVRWGAAEAALPPAAARVAPAATGAAQNRAVTEGMAADAAQLENGAGSSGRSAATLSAVAPSGSGAAAARDGRGGVEAFGMSCGSGGSAEVGGAAPCSPLLSSPRKQPAPARTAITARHAWGEWGEGSEGTEEAAGGDRERETEEAEDGANCVVWAVDPPSRRSGNAAGPCVAWADPQADGGGGGGECERDGIRLRVPGPVCESALAGVQDSERGGGVERSKRMSLRWSTLGDQGTRAHLMAGTALVFANMALKNTLPAAALAAELAKTARPLPSHSGFWV